MTRLNFVRRSTPPSGWRLLLLGLGMLMLLPATANWISALQTLERLQQQLTARPTVQQPPLQLQPQADLQRKAVAATIRQLNLPVTRLLKALIAPADIHVALLTLDLRGQPPHSAATDRGALKLSVEAETAADMLHYLAYLNEQAVFSSVYLIRHETAAGPDPQPYRFALEAIWRP